jgi:membrane-bound metal-dependent hydrolase YbcI (DUF457 family)
VLGRTHALSGAAGWLGCCTALAAAGHPPAGSIAVVGALVSAGFALAPDIDHPQSTIARTLGPITRLAARAVARLAGGLRAASCDHCGRLPSRGGHRAATHTVVFAAAAGWAATAAAVLFGAPAGLVAVWLATGLAARAMLSPRQRGTLGAVTLATLITAAVAVMTGPSWWWIGLPVAWGTLAHSLGDAATRSGAPLAWPLRIRGCRWQPLGTPRWLRFRTGGPAEQGIWAALAVGTAAGTGYLLALG